MVNIDRKIKRRDQVASGMYDGRYRQRIVVNKKKKQLKEWARGNNKVERLKD